MDIDVWIENDLGLNVFKRIWFYFIEILFIYLNLEDLSNNLMKIEIWILIWIEDNWGLIWFDWNRNVINWFEFGRFE